MTKGWLISRAHPFTPWMATAAIVSLALLLPTPTALVAMYGSVVLIAVAGGAGRAVRQAIVLALPLWAFLLMLHGLLGDGPSVSRGGVEWSTGGVALALAQGSRLGAIITASLATWHAFHPARFVDAVVERGGRRRWIVAYAVTSTLHTIHRFQIRARTILESQRTRGLRYGGSPWHKVRALQPLALPLMLGALVEIDERTIALDTRGLRLQGNGVRTSLAPRPVTTLDQLVRWFGLVAVVAAAAWRLV